MNPVIDRRKRQKISFMECFPPGIKLSKATYSITIEIYGIT